MRRLFVYNSKHSLRLAAGGGYGLVDVGSVRLCRLRVAFLLQLDRHGGIPGLGQRSLELLRVCAVVVFLHHVYVCDFEVVLLEESVLDDELERVEHQRNDNNDEEHLELFGVPETSQREATSAYYSFPAE